MSGHPTCVNVLDHHSRLVLAHRAAARPDFWGPTEDASGADASGAVEVVVEIDAMRAARGSMIKLESPMRTVPCSIHGPLPLGPLLGLFSSSNS